MRMEARLVDTGTGIRGGEVTIKYTLVCCLLLSFLFAGCVPKQQDSIKKQGMSMFYIVESTKSFDQASADLAAAVRNNGFGVLHVHDLGGTLRKKGVEFKEECRVFEVCNPMQAGKVLAADMRLNMALPCRISVYTEKGQTRIGMIKPKTMLASLSSDPALAEIASEVEAKTIAMIDEAS
jgi:uncharacterized protein (DUF302 family)